MRDPVQTPQTEPFWGRLYGMTVWRNYGMTPLHVILVLLARISVFREKRDRTLLEIPDPYLTSLLFPLSTL